MESYYATNACCRICTSEFLDVSILLWSAFNLLLLRILSPELLLQIRNLKVAMAVGLWQLVLPQTLPFRSREHRILNPRALLRPRLLPKLQNVLSRHLQNVRRRVPSKAALYFETNAPCFVFFQLKFTLPFRRPDKLFRKPRGVVRRPLLWRRKWPHRIPFDHHAWVDASWKLNFIIFLKMIQKIHQIKSSI